MKNDNSVECYFSDKFPLFRPARNLKNYANRVFVCDHSHFVFAAAKNDTKPATTYCFRLMHVLQTQNVPRPIEILYSALVEKLNIKTGTENVNLVADKFSGIRFREFCNGGGFMLAFVWSFEDECLSSSVSLFIVYVNTL